MINELKLICIKIHLLQDIKEIPIFSKTTKELGNKNQEEKERMLRRFNWLENWRYYDGETNSSNIYIYIS